jgi:hypothetical protein
MAITSWIRQYSFPALFRAHASVAGSCSTVPESSTACSTADVFLFEITPVVGRPCWIDSTFSSRAQAHSSTAHHRLHGSFLLQSVSLVIYHILSSISVSVASCVDFSRSLMLSDHRVWLSWSVTCYATSPLYSILHLDWHLLALSSCVVRRRVHTYTTCT